MLLSSEGAELSQATQAVVDQEVARIVADAYGDAVALISAQEGQLGLLAGALLSAGSPIDQWCALAP
jgi:hypothetical protein